MNYQALIVVTITSFIFAACVRPDVQEAFRMNISETPASEPTFRTGERLRTITLSSSTQTVRAGQVDGLHYEYYRNNTGYASGLMTSIETADFLNRRELLRFRCSAERMDGGSSCEASIYSKVPPPSSQVGQLPARGFIIVRLNSSGAAYPHQICASRHDFPGRNARIRIDGGEPINLGANGCTSNRSVINGFVNANEVFVEYVKWPNSHATVSQVEMNGVRHLVEMMQFAQQNRLSIP